VRTDELNCEILRTDASYLKYMPPPSNEDGSLAQVKISVDILGVLEINEMGHYVSIYFNLRQDTYVRQYSEFFYPLFTNRLYWFDKRVEMINLHENANLNILSSEFRDQIWAPRLVFFNTEDKQATEIDEKTFAAVLKNGSYEIASLSKVSNEHLFKGSENPIIMERSYSTKFICMFDMSVYPFDNQECSIILTMDGNSGSFVDLIINDLIYSGPIDLNQYFVKASYYQHYTIPPGM
jgi:hypothetical protein